MRRIKYIFGDILVIQEIRKNAFYESEYDRLDKMGTFTQNQINEHLESRGIKDEFRDEKTVRFDEEIKREEVISVLQEMPLSEVEKFYNQGILNPQLKYLIEQSIKQKIEEQKKKDNPPQAFAFLMERIK